MSTNYITSTRTTPLTDEMRKRQLELWTLPVNTICDGLTTCECGSKKVTHVEKQLRSGDEGMTVIAHCTICGKRWKI